MTSACDSRPPRLGGWDGTYPIKITVTTAMIGDLVKGVGRDRVFIEVLMGPGTDPHLYKASPDDVRKLGEAVGIAYNGLHLEGKMGEVLESMAKKKPTLAVAEALPQGRLIQVGEVGGKPTFDPHVWFDVKLFSEALGPIAAWLSEIDPDSADFFKANAEEYAFGLSQMDDYVRAAMADIPKERRVLITAHDAFAYWGRAYDLEVRGIQGISTESEAGLKEINDLVNLIVERKIPSVFVETSVSEKNVQSLVQGARARGWNVGVGDPLFSDAMGTKAQGAHTYMAMINYNTNSIRQSLLADR